jgi:hypothetical protein
MRIYYDPSTWTGRPNYEHINTTMQYKIFLYLSDIFWYDEAKSTLTLAEKYVSWTRWFCAGITILTVINAWISPFIPDAWIANTLYGLLLTCIIPNFLSFRKTYLTSEKQLNTTFGLKERPNSPDSDIVLRRHFSHDLKPELMLVDQAFENSTEVDNWFSDFRKQKYLTCKILEYSHNSLILFIAPDKNRYRNESMEFYKQTTANNRYHERVVINYAVYTRVIPTFNRSDLKIIMSGGCRLNLIGETYNRNYKKLFYVDILQPLNTDSITPADFEWHFLVKHGFLRIRKQDILFLLKITCRNLYNWILQRRTLPEDKCLSVVTHDARSYY